MDKDKTMTRQEAMSKEKLEKEEAINSYYVQKAISLIKRIHTEKLNFHKLHIILKILYY